MTMTLKGGGKNYDKNPKSVVFVDSALDDDQNDAAAHGSTPQQRQNQPRQNQPQQNQQQQQK